MYINNINAVHTRACRRLSSLANPLGSPLVRLSGHRMHRIDVAYADYELDSLARDEFTFSVALTHQEDTRETHYCCQLAGTCCDRHACQCWQFV